MKACRYYSTPPDGISYEYMMARDKTDRPWQADLLAKLLKKEDRRTSTSFR